MLVSGVTGKAAGQQEEVGGGGQDEVGRRQACTGAGRVSDGPSGKAPPLHRLMLLTRHHQPALQNPSIPGATLGRCHGNRATQET